MTCERCGKIIVAPIEFGDFYICKDCNDNVELYIDYNKQDDLGDNI